MLSNKPPMPLPLPPMLLYNKYSSFRKPLFPIRSYNHTRICVYSISLFLSPPLSLSLYRFSLFLASSSIYLLKISIRLIIDTIIFFFFAFLCFRFDDSFYLFIDQFMVWQFGFTQCIDFKVQTNETSST